MSHFYKIYYQLVIILRPVSLNQIFLSSLESVFMGLLFTSSQTVWSQDPSTLSKSIEVAKELLFMWVNVNISKTQEYTNTCAINRQSGDVTCL